MTITPNAIVNNINYAVDFGLFLSGVAVDSVAIFDQNFNQQFQYARPVKAEVIPKARLMDHPLENGQIITDYKIILPLEIRIPVIIPSLYYTQTYNSIYQAWSTSALLTILTHVGYYSNMVIAEMPHEEQPDRFDVITVNLIFKQIQIVGQMSNFSPADPTQVDSQNVGFQSAKSYLGSALNYSKIIGGL